MRHTCGPDWELPMRGWHVVCAQAVDPPRRHECDAGCEDKISFSFSLIHCELDDRPVVCQRCAKLLTLQHDVVDDLKDRMKVWAEAKFLWCHGWKQNYKGNWTKKMPNGLDYVTVFQTDKLRGRWKFCVKGYYSPEYSDDTTAREASFYRVYENRIVQPSPKIHLAADPNWERYCDRAGIPGIVAAAGQSGAAHPGAEGMSG